MDIRPLSGDYAVSPQIAPADVEALRAAGFTTVICNRPDDEIPPPLRIAPMRAAVEAAGLTFVENPVTPGAITPENLEAQASAMAGSAGPVLAYCASGNRSALVWSLVRAPELGADGVLQATRKAGYDHAPFRPHLEAAAKG